MSPIHSSWLKYWCWSVIFILPVNILNLFMVSFQMTETSHGYAIWSSHFEASLILMSKEHLMWYDLRKMRKLSAKEISG